MRFVLISVKENEIKTKFFPSSEDASNAMKKEIFNAGGTISEVNNGMTDVRIKSACLTVDRCNYSWKIVEIPCCSDRRENKDISNRGCVQYKTTIPREGDPNQSAACCVNNAKERTLTTVAAFKAKTTKMFHNIGGFTSEIVEMIAWRHLRSKIEEHGLSLKIVELVLVGSRCRGLESKDSAIEIAVALSGGYSENSLYNIFNADRIYVKGVPVRFTLLNGDDPRILEKYLNEVEASFASTVALRKRAEFNNTVVGGEQSHGPVNPWDTAGMSIWDFLQRNPWQ